jgi:RNA polymerase sigma-70 factor (ECF subfamily)
VDPHQPAPEPAGPTSASLLERLKVQDPEAWRRFLRVYGPLVYEWCRAAGLQADDATDICQEVFRAVARNIGTFQRPTSHRGAFRGWLRTVSRNCLHDHFRRRAKRPQAVGGTDFQQRIQELPDLDQDDSVDSVAAETVGIVRRALEVIQPEFAEQTWKAFTQVALDGRSPAEVADELHITAFAVRQANYRVRRRRREELCELLD